MIIIIVKNKIYDVLENILYTNTKVCKKKSKSEIKNCNFCVSPLAQLNPRSESFIFGSDRFGIRFTRNR